MKKYSFLLMLTTAFIGAKTYKLTNLTKHETLKVQVKIQGPSCGTQITAYDIKQKENEEIITARRCTIKDIHLIPAHGIEKEEIIKAKEDIDENVTTIAIKHAADGYKLTYY